VAKLAAPTVRGASIMGVLTLIASALNYGSNLIFSRLLDPEGFGELTALLSLSVVLTIPTGAAQTVIAGRVAAWRAQGRDDIVRYLVRHALGHVLAIALAVGAVYTVAIPLVIEVMQLREPGPAVALAPLVILSFIYPVFLATLQGTDRFIALGVLLLAIAFSRIAFGVPWAAAGGGAGGAIAGQALGMLVAIAVSGIVLGGYLERRGKGAATSGFRRRPDMGAISASLAFIAFALVANLDILLAKLFLDPRQMGDYSALATLAKIVLFLPAAIGVAMVPSAARAQDDRVVRARVLRLSALSVLGTTLLVSVPAAVFPETVIRLMFGASYLDAASGVLPIVIAGTGLSLLNLLVVYTVTVQDRRWVRIMLVGVVAQTIGIAAFHESPTQVAIVQAIAVAGVLAANELTFHSLLRPVRRPAPT
jgi:O-antigen/teichoic acid export membrane protein